MRVFKLIMLLVLALAASLARPHFHSGQSKGDDTVCAKCQVRDNPAEVGEVPVAPSIAPVAYAAPRLPTEVVGSPQHCLSRAPKQGPPAA